MDQVQGHMDGPRLLRMRLGELVPLVRVELRSWGWGLASLPSLRSLGWNCALGVGVSISPLIALVSVELRSWGWVVGGLGGWGVGWLGGWVVGWLTPPL